MKIMTKEQMDKYAYELMIKNNPEEAVKNLLLKDKQLANLQEENKLLKMDKLEKQFPDLNAVKVRIDTYKSRNEKAIKYINKNLAPFSAFDEETKDLINILQGEDKE